ncbi:MAG: tetratricopeptide repeat protein [Isosphaeraceae bacterium]
MGTKTVWRVMILFAGLTLLIVGGYFFRQWRVEKMSYGVLAQAARAEGEGDYGRAVKLYGEHLMVMPDDVDVRLKLAEAMLKQDPSNQSRRSALEIFDGILNQYPSREDARRRAAEVAVEMGGGMFEKARAYLKILLRTAGEDGHLEYLMGRCYEADNEPAPAAESYASAIAHGAPERIDAAARRAVLLRGQLNKAAEADKLVEAMVREAAGDYRAHLSRGVYRELFRLPGSEDDFRKAMELQPDKPDVYLQMALAAERKGKLDDARQVLDRGLAAMPKAVELYLALATLEERAGRGDRAIAALELGLKVLPDDLELLAQAALRLAEGGETGRLLTRISDLERIGAGQPFTQYLRGYYFFNMHEFDKARKVLTPVLPDVAGSPQLKSRVNLLLAQVYAELSEPELQREKSLLALTADPTNVLVRLRYIKSLIDSGDLDQAIEEYRGLAARYAGLVRLPLAELLILQARRLPPEKRNWAEPERLIAQAAAETPGAVEPALLHARLLVEQGQQAKALDELETARGRFPTNPGPWIDQADMLVRLGRLDEAQRVLDGARERLGDRVDLRLARQRLVVARGGSRVVPALGELAVGIEAFSHEDRRRLLTSLAADLARQQDLSGAIGLYTKLVELEPGSLQPKLQLFDLALRAKDRRLAEAQIDSISKLDDEQFGQYCRATYFLWQAADAADAARAAAFRRDARKLLDELRTRRPDWPKVQLALAALSEQEMNAPDLDDSRKRESLLAAIAAYRRAIDLGLRDPAIVRRAVALLFRAGRGSEALDVYGQIPSAVQFSGAMSQEAVRLALAQGNYRQAEEIARKAVEANPGDFQARVWLAQVLFEERQIDQAEAELRKAVDAAKADPERWLTLLRFDVLNRRMEKAEQVVQEAEASLTGSPLDLARLCQSLGAAYATTDPDLARPWFDRARGWFDKARAVSKDPGDLTINRRFAEFLLQAGQNAEAEGYLKEILTRAAGKSSDAAAWARRNLARIYALSMPPRIAEALALFADQKGRAGAEADDLRILALVHEAQRSVDGRRQAIDDLQALIDRQAAQPDDRRRLALLLEANGDWPRAREQFRELILRTEGVRDPAGLNERLSYLYMFAERLVRHHQPSDDSDLVEARELLAKFRSVNKDPLPATILEARIDKAAGKADAAVTRLRELAGRSSLPAQARLTLANEAEQLGRSDAAEAIYRAVANTPPIENRYQLALFLARHGRLPEALDLCEALLTDPAIRDRGIVWGAQLVGDPSIPLDKAQAARVVAWVEKGLSEKPRFLVYLLALGNVSERMGEYSRAEELYRAALKLNDRDGIAANNLAWLITLQHSKDRSASELTEALDLINNAIRTRGPIPEYLDTRGVIYLSAGDGPRAIADLEAAAQAAPNGAKYFHLARAYLKANDRERARKSLEDGKTRGLPSGLHPLEMASYKQVATELGMP